MGSGTVEGVIYEHACTELEFLATDRGIKTQQLESEVRCVEYDVCAAFVMRGVPRCDTTAELDVVADFTVYGKTCTVVCFVSVIFKRCITDTCVTAYFDAFLFVFDPVYFVTKRADLVREFYCQVVNECFLLIARVRLFHQGVNDLRHLIARHRTVAAEGTVFIAVDKACFRKAHYGIICPVACRYIREKFIRVCRERRYDKRYRKRAEYC